MIIRNQYMGKLAKPIPNTMPDKCVPDQAMSIAEIFSRYARGLPVGGQRVEFYEEDDDPEESTMPTGLDKIETIEWIRQNKLRIEELRGKLNSINEQQARSQAAETIKSKSEKTLPEEKN